MSGSELPSVVIQVAAVAAVLAFLALPYFLSERVKTSVSVAAKLACVEALLLAGLLVFGAAIVAPITASIVLQGLVGGAVVSSLVFGGWLFMGRLKGRARG